MARDIDRRMVEIDLKAQFVTVIGVQPRPLLGRTGALPNLDRFDDADEVSRRILKFNTGALQQKDKGCR